MIFFLFFIFGLAIGSFLNVVIARLDTNQSIVGDRSRCPHCDKILRWYELAPLISFIVQKGRCRNCQKSISCHYPVVEISTGSLFLLIFNQFSISNFSIINLFSLIYWLFIASILIIIFVYDFKYYIIPDKIIWPAILISSGFNALNLFLVPDPKFQIFHLIWHIIFSQIGAIFFLILIIISKGEWMGLGDVKLAVLMGLILGWPKILAALFFSFMIGSFVSVILMIFKRKNIKDRIPFGPFLILGTFIALFLGDQVLNWYLKFIF
ncbi:MAG: prepilin peptidase [Parcubacteria group bacterium]|nr:prepilin peptidase [Parcubacteria group bacterium]